MFWHEVKKATVLEASVLHRYFGQVRDMALKKIRAGYSSVDQFDISFFTTRLFFDNDQHCEDYLACHNIYPNDDGLYIVGDFKKSYTDPEEALPIWLSDHILNKIGDQTTPGDLMWGSHRVLNSWSQKNYNPTSSFTTRTVHLIESARDIVERVEERVNESASDDYETQILSDEVDQLTGDVVQSAVSEIAMSTVISERRLIKRAQHNVEILCDHVVQSELRKITANTILGVRIEEEEIALKEAESVQYYHSQLIKWKAEYVDQIHQTIFETVANELTRDILHGHVKSHTQERNMRLLTELVSEKTAEIESDFVQSAILTMLNDAVDEIRTAQAKRVTDMRARRQVRLVKQAAVWWLRQTRSAIRRRQARQLMPKLASENLLAKIGKSASYRPGVNRKSLELMTQDELTKSWKQKRQIQISKKQIARFNATVHIETLFKDKLYSPNRLIASIFIQHPPELGDYASKKFGQRTVTRR